MRAKKICCVIAYDIVVAKRRRSVIKLISPYGKRINFSVYECMFTAAQLKIIISKLHAIVKKREDQIAVYRICVDCFSKTEYIPPLKESAQIVNVFD